MPCKRPVHRLSSLGRNEVYSGVSRTQSSMRERFTGTGNFFPITLALQSLHEPSLSAQELYVEKLTLPFVFLVQPTSCRRQGELASFRFTSSYSLPDLAKRWKISVVRSN